MSESSEKKLLKNILGKLRKRAIDSQKDYLDMATTSIKKLGELTSHYDKIVEQGQKSPEKLSGVLNSFLGALNALEEFLHLTFIDSSAALEDIQLYVSSLEEYSAQLDETLTGIFDAAKEEMEKLETKRKELQERHPEYVK